MNNQIEQQNLELLEQYFRDGCKWNCLQKLGVELEHFVIDRKNQKNVSYYGPDGIEELLEEWKEYYPGHERENGRLLGLYNNDYALSLEPAAQLEISIAPKESLRCIEKIYRNFSEAVRPSLERRGYELVTRGYRPFGCVDELDLIPKKRYEYMDAYFQESGTTGRNMMRGTAAAQVSIDYCCEQDFISKYRTAYLIMPALKLLSDNTAVLEEKPYPGHLARTWIWDHVDSGRCGILPGIFEEDFGFHTYAEYLWNLEPIFLPEDGGYRSTGHQKVRDLWSDRLLTRQDMEHILSMTFLDVRVKHYVEIRGADSMPLPYVLAYTALVKGLTFEKEVREELLARYSIQEEDIRKAERSLAEHGYEGEIYGEPAAAFIGRLLQMAEDHLEPEERKYLQPLSELVQRKESLKEQERQEVWK